MRLIALLLVALPALPAMASAQTTTDPKGTIVVTGKRLEDTERALNECIARKCPPDQDIAASLAHAENQFVAGKYRDARRTLLAARSRDRRYASQFPVAVAGLVRANARIAAHLGEGDAYQLGTIDIVDALKAGLPDNDPRVFYARVEVGDMYARMGREEAAQGMYEAVIAKAHALKLYRAEALAMLHLASMFNASARDTGKTDAAAAKLIAALAERSEPEFKPFAQAAKVLAASMAFRAGDSRSADRLVALAKEIPPTDKPVLIYSPSIAYVTANGRSEEDRAQTSDLPVSNDLNTRATRDYEDQWVDISFYVAPDGHVTDAAIVRQSKPKLDDPYWANEIVKAIGKRQYLPLRRDPTDPGVLRIERYTLTSLWGSRPGTNLRERQPYGRIEMLDLSVDEPVRKAEAPAPAPGTS